MNLDLRTILIHFGRFSESSTQATFLLPTFSFAMTSDLNDIVENNISCVLPSRSFFRLAVSQNFEILFRNLIFRIWFFSLCSDNDKYKQGRLNYLWSWKTARYGNENFFVWTFRLLLKWSSQLLCLRRQSSLRCSITRVFVAMEKYSMYVGDPKTGYLDKENSEIRGSHFEVQKWKFQFRNLSVNF